MVILSERENLAAGVAIFMTVGYMHAGVSPPVSLLTLYRDGQIMALTGLAVLIEQQKIMCQRIIGYTPTEILGIFH